MKYALIIPDGAADVPLEDLDGRTPLEAAAIPHLDWIATHGKCGTVRTIPEGLPAGSDVAILSVLGYDPRRFYTGRAPLEAAAKGLRVGPDEWIFRCNLVTTVEGRMEDYSAGHITTEEATALIQQLETELGGEDMHFYPGVGYRHLMTCRGEVEVETTPPHDIPGQAIEQHRPRGAGAEKLIGLMERSERVLRNSEINAVRRDLGENPATSIWLWGHGKMPDLPAYAERYGRRGAAITAVDLVRGLSKLIGWEVIEVPGATGYVDTNYAGKGAAAVAALDEYDVVCVHVEAPDEAGHNGNFAHKIEALEQIDRHVVGPVLQRLGDEGEDWRILCLPDHPTPCTLRTHVPEPVPFAIAGKRVAAVLSGPFTEKTGADADLHIDPGSDLMEYFLTIR